MKDFPYRKSILIDYIFLYKLLWKLFYNKLLQKDKFWLIKFVNMHINVLLIKHNWNNQWLFWLEQKK